MILKTRRLNLAAILFSVSLLLSSGCNADAGIINSVLNGLGDAISSLAEAGLLTFLT